MTKQPILGNDVAIDVDRLLVSRLLVQANSGGGKSYAIRRLLEQTFGHCQHIVIDPEGEFHTLRERFDYVLAGKGGEAATTLDTAALLAIRLLELGVSAIVDISELGQFRPAFVAKFLDALIGAPRELWHPVLVVVDEAHRYCPEQGKARRKHERKAIEDSAAAVISLMDSGRKRGFCGVLATQRISKLSKDATAECNNKLVGRSVEVDAKRAAEELGLSSRDAMQQLRSLRAGQFFAFGPALSEQIQVVQVGPVQTTHPEAGKAAPPPTPPRAKVREVLGELSDLPAEAAEEARTAEQLRARVRQLETELVAAKRAAPEPTVERVEVPVPVLDREQLAALLAGIEALGAHTAELDRIRDRLAQAQQIVVSESDNLRTFARQLAPSPPAIVSPQTGRKAVPPATPAPASAVAKSKPAGSERRVSGVTAGETAPDECARSSIDTKQIVNGLAAVEAFGLPRTIAALAAWLSVHPRSGSFLKALGAARQDELVEGLDLTARGRTFVDIDASESTAVSTLRRPLAESQLRIIDTIASLADRKVTIPMLAAWVGIHPRSSSFLTDLGKLRERSYVSGTELTALGAAAAESRDIDDMEIVEKLDDLQRRIVESTGSRGEFKTIADLASSLGVHPRSSSFLGDIGKLRERGLVSKGWPLRLTDVFIGDGL